MKRKRKRDKEEGRVRRISFSRCAGGKWLTRSVLLCRGRLEGSVLGKGKSRSVVGRVGSCI